MPRGKKTCEQCGTTCGPRTYKCGECGHPFTIKGKTSSPAVPPASGPPSIGPPSLSKPPGPPSIPSKVKPTVEPGDAPVVIVAADPYEIDKFILALKAARDKNRHGGGGYAAFFHVDDKVVLRFDVQVPIDLLPYSHKKVT